MRTIDIITTQNVEINYALASLGQRALAWLIDIIAIVILNAIFINVIDVFRDSDTRYVLEFFLIYPTLLCYTLISENILKGQTLGKKAIGIRVVHLQGRQLTFTDYYLRWVFRMVDLYLSFGSVAALVSLSSPYGQRVGGVLSNTTVVRVRNQTVSLSDILRIQTIDNYTPQYEMVKSMKEEEMLVIKETLERYERYKNPAHKSAVLLLVEKMTALLGLEEEPKEKLKFLRTLVKDYIVLTR